METLSCECFVGFCFGKIENSNILSNKSRLVERRQEPKPQAPLEQDPVPGRKNMAPKELRSKDVGGKELISSTDKLQKIRGVKARDGIY